MKRTLLLAAAGITAGLAAAAYFKSPTATEAVVTGQSAVETKQARPLVEVNLPAELSPLAQTGEKAFDAVCAACHGTGGVGNDGVGPPLVHKIYEPNHHGDMSFLMAVTQGVRAHHWTFGDMPPQEGLTQGDVRAIVAYVRELQRFNGIE
ncbi:MAG: cytochrome c [Paracoccaceae bacterium]|jgi:mono/diheme cytochrome c family protein